MMNWPPLVISITWPGMRKLQHGDFPGHDTKEGTFFVSFWAAFFETKFALGDPWDLEVPWTTHSTHSTHIYTSRALKMFEDGQKWSLVIWWHVLGPTNGSSQNATQRHRDDPPSPIGDGELPQNQIKGPPIFKWGGFHQVFRPNIQKSFFFRLEHHLFFAILGLFFLGPKRFIRTSEILDPKTRLPMFGKSPW